LIPAAQVRMGCHGKGCQQPERRQEWQPRHVERDDRADRAETQRS
jgi:hypothetical protein